MINIHVFRIHRLHALSRYYKVKKWGFRELSLQNWTKPTTFLFVLWNVSKNNYKMLQL